MLGQVPKKNSEFRPLITPSPTKFPNPNNINNSLHDNEFNITNKLKRFLQPITSPIASQKSSSRLNHNQSRKRATIDLRSRDYKSDASGKRGFQVQIPMKILTYITIVFFLVPLMAGFVILVRIFFRDNGTVHANKGLGKFEHAGVTMEESAIMDATENQQISSLNSLRGRNDGSSGFGIDLTGEETGDIVANVTAQHIDEQAMKLDHDTAPILEQQNVEKEDGASNANVFSPDVDKELVDKNTVSVSTNTKNDGTEALQINSHNEKVISLGNKSKKVRVPI